MLWHSSDGLDGTVPGAKSARMAHWTVVRCHLARGVGRLLDLVVGATSPSPPRLPAPDRAVSRASVDAPDTLGKMLGPERFQQLRELSPVQSSRAG